MRLAELALPDENPSGAVYGMIVIGALLAAESGLHETYLETISSAAVATALYWLAHAYAGALGQRLATGACLTPAVLVRALAHDRSLIQGASVPLLALSAAWIVGAPQQTAVTAALWSAIVSLILFELIAGLRARASAGEILLETSIGATIGLGILALKAILH
jgi:hypothetical protein